MFDRFYTTASNNYLLLACILSSILVPLNSTMIASALPEIGKTFNVSLSFLTIYLIDAYLLVNILLQAVAGRMGDIYGRHIVLNVAHSLIILGSLFALVKFSFSLLVVGRILVAAGGSIIVPNTIALICETQNNIRKTYMLGIANSAFCFSAGFGPLIGGIITHLYGWQSIFLINIPFLLFSWSLIIKKESFKNETIKRTTENFSSSTFITKKIYKNYQFIIGNALIFTQNVILYGLLIAVPFLLSTAFNENSFETGRIIFLMTIFMAIFTFLMTQVRSESRNVFFLLVEIFSTFTGLVLLYFSLKVVSLDILLIALCLIGASIGAGYASAQSLILSASLPECRGFVSGITSMIRYLGGITGITIFSIISATLNIENIIMQSRICALIYACISAFTLLVLLALVLTNLKKDNDNFLIPTLN
ncbi:MAG: MFS transporter [Gammaproteobacteria bacterium]